MKYVKIIRDFPTELLPYLTNFDLTGLFCTTGSEREFTRREAGMATNKYKPQHVVRRVFSIAPAGGGVLLEEFPKPS
jgi:hypothetical protein